MKTQHKIGVYVDAANISRNGGQRMQYDILREFACRDGAEAQRLNVYLAYDEEREVVLIYGIYRGVITMSEKPQPFETDYVYILKFSDGKISHVTKVWQDDID